MPITSRQQGTFQIRQVVYSNAGAHNMDTSGYELRDMEDLAFFWENAQVDFDAIFSPGLGIRFSPTVFNDLEKTKRGSSEKSIVLDEEEDKENSQTTLKFERPTEPPSLLRSRPFGTTRIEN